MQVLVATDFTICRSGGRWYTQFVFSSIIQRYNDVFGKLSLCCRVADETEKSLFPIDITDQVEEVTPITLMQSLLGTQAQKVKQAVQRADLIIPRFAGFIPLHVAAIARKMKKPVFSEVMSCGWDGFWNHSWKGKLLAPYMYFGVRHALKQSDYALYVTEQFLQRRYPCPNPTVGVSNVVIDSISDAVREKRHNKIRTMDTKNITLMTSAAVNVYYKGQHFVIRAIPKLNQMGIRVKYYCVGGGDPGYLRKVAQGCGVEDQVVFTGAVSHDRVFELLDECDIYVQPSLQEGLPRALVEAMSRGCPAIGARTGGIPELLPEECIVERKAVDQIADAICSMLDNKMNKYAQTSFCRAKDFEKEVLNKKRNEYFYKIKQDVVG